MPPPARRAGRGEALGVACLHEGLGLAVLVLLPQVDPESGPAVVPDDSRGVEAELPVAVLDLPT
jgi:hypothetical protein